MLCVLWVTQTIGFFGYSSWAPTLLAQEGMSVEKSLFFVALTTVGAPLGCFLAALVTDRFERKWCLVVFGAIIALSGLFYGLTFNPIMIVAFGFLVNFFERGYTALAYAYSPEVFDTRTRSLGTAFSYGLGRLSNAVGPLDHRRPLHRVRLPERLLLHRRHLAVRSDRPGPVRSQHPTGPARPDKTGVEAQPAVHAHIHGE